MGDTLRERKKRDTRIALSWAAIELVVRRGLENVKVEDIAAAAGVSPRTFNNYFSSKGEAIAFRQLERIRQIAGELRDRPADEPLWEAVTAAVEARYALGMAAGETSGPDPEWAAGIARMVAEPALRGELFRAYIGGETALAEAVAARTGTDVQRDLYPRLVAGAIGVAMREAMAHSMSGAPMAGVIQVLREALDQFAAGLPKP